MAHVLVKITFILFAYFGITNDANATYTPPLKYKLSSAYGGTTYGSRDEVCQALMDKLNLTLTGADRLASIYVCANNEGVRSSNQTSSWIDIHVVYRRVSGSTTTYTGGQIFQECTTVGSVISGYPPNATCSGNPPPPPCAASDVFPATYYSNLCVNGCEQKYNGQFFDMLGVKYYGAIGNTGSVCATGTGNGKAMQQAWDENKAASDAAAASAKAAKDAADKAAADAKNAAAKAAADAAAKAAEQAKQAAAEAKAKADASKAASDKIASDAGSTQAQKDAAAAQSAADKTASDAANSAAATAVGKAAGEQKSEAPEKQKDFCETNPNSMICKNSQINSGSCSKGQPIGFQCEGDAILCGLAKGQVTAFCASQEVDDGLKSAYETMKTENGSNSPSDASKVTTINLPTALNASSPYAAQCNPDVTVHVASSSVTLPFSAWCPYLNALGYLFLTMAYMSAAVIISRG